jgi:ABC-type transport system involved in multi-copper enzyme maturation permease subunit
MSPFVQATRSWLKRNLTGSNTREAWEERLGVALILLGAVGIGWIHDKLTLAQELVLWGVLLMTTAVLLRRGWFRLCGPMLFYDLVRVARRTRYFYFRCFYAFFLGLILCWIYFIQYMESQSGRLSSNEMARFAETFFYTFMGIQFLVVAVLTPAYTAGAIAEETDRKTLEFILATDLLNREIILSKLLSRLANLTLLLLTGLPILSALQFLGGVDPNLVLTGFAATGLTMISLAGFSILNSVMSKKPRDAIALTYLGAVGYLLLSGGGWFLLTAPTAWAYTLTPAWLGAVTVEDAVRGISIGNPLVQVGQVIYALERGKRVADILPPMLANYALFHGVAALLCVGWSILRLRALALQQSYGKQQKLSAQARFWGRPRVGSHPMLWKEVIAESRLRFNFLGRIVLILLIVGSFVPVIMIFGYFLQELRTSFAGRPRIYGGYDAWEQLAEAMNWWVRIIGTAVACLMLLAVAARASSSISNERDRQTLDGLLTTPLDSNNILFAKWVGNICCVRWAWLWLGVIFALGLGTGGLHVLAVPLLLGAWLVYAAVLSGLGLWFSLVSKTTLRATIWTLLSTAGAGVGHWLLWICWLPFTITLSREPALIRWLYKLQAGLTPPLTLADPFCFRGEEFTNRHNTRAGDQWEVLAFGVFGVFCWAVVAAVLWSVTSARFRVVSGRVPFRRAHPVASTRRTLSPADDHRQLDGQAAKPRVAVAAKDAPASVQEVEPIEEKLPQDPIQQPPA